MRAKIVWALNILIIASAAGIIIWQVFFADKPDMKLVLRSAVVLAAYLLGILGIYRKKSPFDYKLYEEKYRDIIGDAFKNDKKSYRRLMKAITQFNRDEYDAALKALRKLEAECVSADDFSAVLLFEALTLEAQNRSGDAMAVYEELLVHDNTNATAWSNLGLIYQYAGRADDAYRAFSESIRYNPENSYAYSNIAVHFLRNGEPENALKNAQKAIGLNSRLYQAMSAAAVACKQLGDDENAEKYCRMYGVNGGDAAQLRKTLESWENT